MTSDDSHPFAPAPTPLTPAPEINTAMPATAPPKKMRKPAPRVRAAIELLVTGRARTITAAAKKVGLSREYLSRAFALPHNAEALRTRAAREVALSSGRAAARLSQLIDSTSQKVALEATKFSLGVAGIKPASDGASVNVNVELRAGYVLDLRGRNPRAEPVAKIVGGVTKVIESDAKPAE